MYFFDFKRQQIDFSRTLMVKQANFVAKKVKQLVYTQDYTNVNFITHSIGEFVAQLAIDRDIFPVSRLSNIFSLASPHAELPQLLTDDLKDVKEYIDAMENLPDIAVFNFDGGLKDIYSGDALAKE